MELGAAGDALKDYGQTIEGLGYDYILTPDHVVGSSPQRDDGQSIWVTNQHAFLDPFVFFGYLASATQTLGFATGILILPQRQTVLVAKQAALVDFLSGGRLRLGVGVGWNELEYKALNKSFQDRGKRYDEQVELLRALWTQPLVTFRGEYHKVLDAGINPMPVQRPIPLWFGGWSEAALSRAGRLGDGWVVGGGSPSEAAEAIDKLHQTLWKNDRSAEDLGIDAWININEGTLTEWSSLIDRWRDLGATHITIFTAGEAPQSMDRHLELLRQFQEAGLTSPI
jgi:probable F420-dependent oxidoreductase